jgi:hypothetical protein
MRESLLRMHQFGDRQTVRRAPRLQQIQAVEQERRAIGTEVEGANRTSIGAAPRPELLSSSFGQAP